MKELREIVTAHDQTLGQGRKMALASVVQLEGSSYRRPGARMLVDDEGHMTGAISGGCLEGDALRKAQLVIAQQVPRVVSYDTSDEDDMSVGVQLGCAGVIHVLFEPIGPNNPVELLKKLLSKRQNAVLVNIYGIDKKQEQFGTCLLMEEDGSITCNFPVDDFFQKIIDDTSLVLQEGRSSYKTYTIGEQEYTAFMEFIPPPISMVVVGAGNDAIPLVNIATELGWDATVVDGRRTHARPERFAAACQVLVSKPEAVLDQVVIDPQTVFVLMTHNYNYDLAMLKALLLKDAVFIGILGPRKKLDRMIEELKDSGMVITEETMSRLYGPVGLEIGAETPEEIALSIIAEIKAATSGKNGGSLRNKKGTIHPTTNQ